MIPVILLSVLCGFVIGFLFWAVVIRRAIRIYTIALVKIYYSPHLDMTKLIAYDALADAGAEYKIEQYRERNPAPPHIVDVQRVKK